MIPIKAQMGEWKEASEKATEEVTIGLGLLSATEIRTNYFKLQPHAKKSGKNLDKPRTALVIKLVPVKFLQLKISQPSGFLTT